MTRDERMRRTTVRIVGVSAVVVAMFLVFLGLLVDAPAALLGLCGGFIWATTLAWVDARYPR